jgi:geranylgeranyl transferase type-2 subunit alpha
MHGRLKVKTSAQQEAEKKADRAKKCAGYKATMNNIFGRREAGEKDDLQLKMTGGVLMGNPDITTLWNIRKEVIEEKLKGADDDADALLLSELDLTQQCLMTNPKSYGAWYHRCWCLERMKNPGWDREVKLCNRYIELDERNFHCWDYRRYVNGGLYYCLSVSVSFSISFKICHIRRRHFRCRRALLHDGPHQRQLL